MHAIDRFSLERHTGPYDTWPRRTLLLDRGTPTKIKLPAFVLLHQFEVPGGYLLVLDDDCPHEEITTFCLLDPHLRVHSRRWIGVPYGSFYLRAIEWIDERRFVADFDWPSDDGQPKPPPKPTQWPPNDRLGFVIRSRGIPYLWPRLAMRDPTRWPPARLRIETTTHWH
jgi:hypothetical protein